MLGGASSGKSAFAESLAAQDDRVLYVATGQALDDEMRRRVEAHQARRPAEWRTLEEPIDLLRRLTSEAVACDAVLIDSLTLWVSNLLLSNDADVGLVVNQVEALLGAYEVGDARWIIVSDEVGMGVVPDNRLSRAFRDALGRANQSVAARADRVYVVKAGLALDFKDLGAKAVLEAREGPRP